MHYYRPDLTVASDDSDSPTLEHLGGLPFGLNATAWPKCAECGGSQSLIAQFMHHAQRLDLGREGRYLLIFQCNHDPGMCATWEAFSGANACLVVEPEDLGLDKTKPPVDDPPIENCAIISGWVETEDGLNEEQSRKFFLDDEFFDLDENILEKAIWSSRLGGVPRWLQSPSEAPSPNWHFLGQLDSSYSFISAPEFQVPWVSADPENFEGRTHIAQGPNFGGGIAYLFVKRETDTPRVVMLWQR